MDIYQYITILAVVVTTIYTTINILTSLSVPLSKSTTNKNSVITRLNVLSNKTRTFYETFQPPWKLGDRNEVKFTIFMILYPALLAFVFFTRDTVSLTTDNAIPLSYLPAILFFMLFPIYITGQMRRLTDVSGSVSTEAGAIQFTKSVGNFVWRLKTLILFASMFTLYYESFIIENASSSLAEQIATYISCVAAALSVVIPSLVQLGKVKNSLETLASSKYFANTNQSVRVEFINHLSHSTTNFSGSIVSLGENIYLKRDDGFFQEVSWKEVANIAVKEIARNP